MSVPFTIDQNDVGSWQEGAEELRLAYSERNHAASLVSPQYKKFEWHKTADATETTPEQGFYRWVTGDGTDADKLPDRTNLQSWIFWFWMQNFYQGSVGNFVPVDATLAGKTLGQRNDVKFASWLDFCEKVGGGLYDDSDPLNIKYGWRRMVTYQEDESGDPIYLRGLHQEGDLIGPWIVEDMVLAANNFVRMMEISGLANSKIEIVDAGSKQYLGFSETIYDRFGPATEGELNAARLAAHADSLTATGVLNDQTWAGAESGCGARWEPYLGTKMKVFGTSTIYLGAITLTANPRRTLVKSEIFCRFLNTLDLVQQAPALWGADVPLYLPVKQFALHETIAGDGPMAVTGNVSGPSGVPYNPAGDVDTGNFKHARLTSFTALWTIDFTNGPEEQI